MRSREHAHRFRVACARACELAENLVGPRDISTAGEGQALQLPQSRMPRPALQSFLQLVVREQRLAALQVLAGERRAGVGAIHGPGLAPRS